MKRWLVSLVLVLVAVVLVFASSCGPGEEAAKTYKLGFLGPLTGPAAAWLVPMLHGTEKAIEEINEAGGIVVGGETYMLQIVSADDRYMPEQSVTAVQKLIFDEKVHYIYGPAGSICGSAVRPITEENHVVIFALTPSGETWTLGPEYPYSFAFMDPYENRHNSAYQWIAENRPEVETVAYIGPHDPGGESTRDRVREAAEAHGIEVVTAELYEAGTVDFAPYLTKMLAKDPNLIDCSASLAGVMALMVKQAREMGYQGLFFAAPYPPEEVLVVGAGVEKAEGFIAAGSPIAREGTPEQRAFFQWAVDTYGEETWTAGYMWSYDWVYWMAQAFEEAGSFDPDVVLPVLEKSELEGLLGKQWFGGTEEWGIARQKVLSPICVVVFHNGQWEPVAHIEVTKD